MEKLSPQDHPWAALWCAGPIIVFQKSAKTGWPIQEVSPNVEAKLGYTSEELKGGHVDFAAMIHEADRHDIAAAIAEHMARGADTFDLEYRIRTKSGAVAHVHEHSMVARNGSGEPDHFVGYILEITKRREAERALRASESELRALLRAMSDVVIVLDRDGRYLSVAPTSPDLFFQPPAEALGKTLHEVFPEKQADRFLACIRAAADTGKPSSIEYGLEIAGEQYWFSGVASPGPEDKVVFVARDITEKRKMQEELLRTQKLESLGVLAGGIAHDFNNLLAAIMGNIALASRKLEGNEAATSRLEEANKACANAKRLTDQLLTFSKGGAPVTRVASISQLVEDSTKLMLSGSNTKPEFELAPDLWLAEVDEGQIGQVVQNIVVNADQAMPGGGKIRVCCDNFSEPGETGRKYVRITIEDSGNGVRSEHLSKIFDPFFSTKEQGRGLGLSTAYSIVNRHGGYIEVRSDPGKGTTFRVFLPATEEKADEPQAVAHEDLRGSGRVLVLDDDAAVRDVTVKTIEDAGYQAKGVSDGTEVLEAYARAKAQGEPFDALVLDLTIPGGMGGKEVMGRLLDLDGQAKAIVASGYSNAPVIAQHKEHGFSGVVTKPFEREDLLRELKAVLGRRGD